MLLQQISEEERIFPLFIAHFVQDIDVVLQVLLGCKSLAAHSTNELLLQEVQGVHVTTQVG